MFFIFLYTILKRKKLIIVCDKYGRLGNRLFLFSQLIEYSFRLDREVWMPGFHEYHNFFESTLGKKFYRFPLGSPSIPNPFSGVSTYDAFNRISQIFSPRDSNKFFQKLSIFDSSSKNPFETIKSSPAMVVLFNGFIFHDHFLDLENSFVSIQKMFKPANQYMSLITEPIQSLRSSSDIVVGVLIRQTDYREWNDGKCFFTSLEYAKIIRRVQESFATQNLSFFIATDEEQEIHIFKELNTTIRVGFPIENLYSLAKCDFLIGPSSSYIAWAALYGKVPLFTIQSPDDCPQRNDFKLISS